MILLLIAVSLLLVYVLFKVLTSDTEWQLKMFILLIFLFGIIVVLSKISS